MPTILVADDNSNIQKMVTLALKDQGIAVVAVGNGEAAVKKLPDVRPDLVLADIFMPVRNGYEVCEYIKKDDRFAHIPVVLLVGAFDPLDEHEVERVHADGVLKKPFVPPDPLITLVKSLLERGAQPPAEASSVARAAGISAGSAAALSSVLSAGTAALEPNRLEETQRLTDEEIQEAARRSMQHAAPPPPPPIAPPPEPEQYSTATPPLAIDEAHVPVAFRDLLEAEEGRETPEESEEGEEATEGRSFEASSLSGYQFHHVTEVESAPTAKEEQPWPEAEEEEDHWGGIKPEMKQPSPPEPPIPVEFGPSEPVEIITEETPPTSEIEVRPAPDLVSSAVDWESAHPPSSAAPQISAESDKEIEAEAPLWEPPPTAPPPPLSRVEDSQEMEPFVISAETPSRREFASPAPPVPRLRDDEPPAMRPSAETQHVAEADETQQFNVPLVEKVTHQAHQPSTSRTEAPPVPAASQTGASTFKAVWDRLEEIAVAGAAVGGAHLISHAQEAALRSVAPPPAEPQVAPRIGIPVSAPPEPPANLVDQVTRKVMAQLRPDFIEQISRELIRPIIEAIVRRELEKK